MTATANTPATAEEIGQQLLNLHLQHELATFDEASFMSWLTEESETIFGWLRSIKLNQLVTAKAIKAVIRRDVIEREIPDAVLETVIAATVCLVDSKKHKNTHLNEIISNGMYEDFVDGILELEQSQREFLARIIDLPIYKGLISGVLYQAIINYIYEHNIVSKNVPGVTSLLKMSQRVVNFTAPKLSGAVEDNVKTYISNNLNFLLDESKLFLTESLTVEEMKSSAMDFLEMLDDETLGELQAGIDSDNVRGFVLLGFEFWLHFRETRYFRSACDLMVDFFFKKYGNNKLGILLDNFEITQQQIMDEAGAFAPRVLNTLKRSGQLEGLIRRRLGSFYSSSAAQDYLNTVV
ncbi:MAG: hypothetical protein QNK19_14495 [Xanthomonadales bacterium]|nr:hypothetical protein [Xanthomonadales bacterium]